MIMSPSSFVYELDRAIIQPCKQVTARSSIRGFKDDYYHLDSDVVLLAGQTHIWRKPVRIVPHYISRTVHAYKVNTNPDIISMFC
jgi:hypothetical protein